MVSSKLLLFRLANCWIFVFFFFLVEWASFGNGVAVKPKTPSSRPSATTSTTRSTRHLVVESLLGQNKNQKAFPIDRLTNAPDFVLLSTRDRAFCRAMVATVERRRGQIQAILQACQTKPTTQKTNQQRRGRLNKVDQLVETVLCVGAAQLLFMETPPHAAVKETIDVLHTYTTTHSNSHHNKPAAVVVPKAKIQFANAVLRRISREGESLLATHAGTLEHNAAAWLVDEWRRTWGPEATACILEAAMTETPRCLTLKDYIPPGTTTSTHAVAALFDQATPLPQGSVRIDRPPPGPVSQWPLYADGAWWLQDVSATVPALALYHELVLQPSQGTVNVDPRQLSVVDLCASPGGKTAQLAAYGLGRVTAVEVSARRARRLQENGRRLGFDHVWDVQVADGTVWKPDSPVDGVLVDVPCTATGTASKRPDVLRRRRSDLDELLAVQAALVQHACDHVLAVGGCLVYSTCSLLKQESEDQIEALLSRGRMERIPFQPGQVPGFDNAIDENGYLRVIPGYNTGTMGPCDGFFVAKLRKVE